MIIDRLLDKTNSDDVVALSDILEFYQKSESVRRHTVYSIVDTTNFIQWIKYQFSIRSSADFAVYGRFEDGELINILIGYKFEISWGREVISNIIPYWCVGLIFYKRKSWTNPKDNIGSMSIDFCRHFQNQGYTKFFMIIKQPKILQSIATEGSYFDDHFKKMIPVNNYTPVIENLFTTQEELDAFRRFSTHSCLLPKIIVRPIMLISFTLKQLAR